MVLLDSHSRGQKESVIKCWENFKRRKNLNINFSIVPHAIYTVSRDNLIWAKNFAQKNKIILHLHLSEIKQEVEDYFKKI